MIGQSFAVKENIIIIPDQEKLWSLLRSDKGLFPVGPDQITLSGKTPVPKYTHPLTDSFDW